MRAHRGMTVLEMMIVLAIIAMATLLLRMGVGALTKDAIVENSNELIAIMRRSRTLAIEHGEMVRITMDMDKGAYVVEECKGSLALKRNEVLTADPEKKKLALEQAKARLQGMPVDTSPGAADPEDATKRALAVAGQHIADRECMPATDSITDTSGKGWIRALRGDKGVKFKEIWVQHRDESVTKGQVAIYFFPNGSSEKSVVEVTNGDETFSVLVYGLTGRVELKDGMLRDVNEHMMRNAMGDKDAKREDER